MIMVIDFGRLGVHVIFQVNCYNNRILKITSSLLPIRIQFSVILIMLVKSYHQRSQMNKSYLV